MPCHNFRLENMRETSAYDRIHETERGEKSRRKEMARTVFKGARKVNFRELTLLYMKSRSTRRLETSVAKA